MSKLNNIPSIPAEKFEFANVGDKIHDKKFEDKPIGYFKDAWIRFRKNKASIIAAVIIIAIVLFSLLLPTAYRIGGKSVMLDSNPNDEFTTPLMDAYYKKMGPRNLFLSQIGIAKGTTNRDFNETGYIVALSKGVGAAGYDGTVPKANEIDEKYNPLKGINEYSENSITGKTTINAAIDTYLEIGFLNIQIEQHEYEKIRAWEKENNLHVLYPLIAENEYNPDKKDANMWYRADGKFRPLNEKDKVMSYSEDMQFVDNYLRDAEGNPVYYKYIGGGTTETAQYQVRVLYYNYYVYQHGFEPEYIFGTDSQGYDLAYRLATGIRLSLLVAIFVSVINFILGAIYGAIQGYYGGTVDILLDRVSDILAGVPFIVVATLFQLHLAKKVGPIPSLLFAFVVTGWIGTAARVRTQFYRFKNQEYVMAARTLGAKDSRIIWKHIFPNTLGTLITSSALVIPSVIFSESMLSFLGIVSLGGSTMTSLGTLLSEASKIWTNYPHLMIFPALIISLLMICFNLFGNGLRDAFNPSLRGVEE